MPSSIQDAKASSPPAVGAVCKLTTFPFPGRRLTPRANRDSQLALARAIGRITPGFNPGPPSCPPLEAYTRSPTPSADASPASVDDWPSAIRHPDAILPSVVVSCEPRLHLPALRPVSVRFPSIRPLAFEGPPSPSSGRCPRLETPSPRGPWMTSPC